MKKTAKITAVWLPPLIAAAVFILRKPLGEIAEVLTYGITICRFYQATGIMCPGCGGTRSLLSLMQGDIVKSLMYNPAVIFGVVTAMLWYAENAAEVMGKKLKLLMRKKLFWIIAGVVFLVWSVLRNFIPAMNP